MSATGGVLGVGIDVVNIDRFGATLERTPRLAARLFTPAERELPPRSLAARFAAKEAVAKALRTPGDLRWHDAEIPPSAGGAPVIHVRGSVAARMRALGVARLEFSMSHDDPVATAIVIACGG